MTDDAQFDLFAQADPPDRLASAKMDVVALRKVLRELPTNLEPVSPQSPRFAVGDKVRLLGGDFPNQPATVVSRLLPQAGRWWYSLRLPLERECIWRPEHQIEGAEQQAANKE